MQFCTTEHSQLFEFVVTSCRICRLRSKKAILEVATSNLHADLTPPNLHNSQNYSILSLGFLKKNISETISFQTQLCILVCWPWSDSDL